MQYFPSAWKNARVVSILKPGKDPALPSSYRPISLLGTVGKLFEKNLLARLVERVNRNFDERRLTGAVFLDVDKAFNTVWVKGRLYKLTVLNVPSYLVKNISSFLD
jgi:hypothetical protein